MVDSAPNMTSAELDAANEVIAQTVAQYLADLGIILPGGVLQAAIDTALKSPPPAMEEAAAQHLANKLGTEVSATRNLTWGLWDAMLNATTETPPAITETAPPNS